MAFTKFYPYLFFLFMSGVFKKLFNKVFFEF